MKSHTLPGRLVRLGTVAAAAALIVGILAVVPGHERRAEAAELTPFDSCQQLRSWFAGIALPQVGPYGLNGGPHVLADTTSFAAGAAEGARSAAADASAVGPGATGTNVQEQGVDEPDLMKTDGSILLTIHNNRLHIIDVTGPSPSQVASVALPGMSATELLLTDNKAIVFGQSWDDRPFEEGRPDIYLPGFSGTTLTIVDLAVPARPRIVRHEELTGSYLSAREHDGVIRVVLSSVPRLPFRMPTSESDEASTTVYNQAVVREADAQDWLPQRVSRDNAGHVAGLQPLLGCDAVSHPSKPAGLGVLTVLTLDVGASEPPQAIAVAADGDQIYASTDRLYVATTSGGWGPMMAVRGPAISPTGDTVTQFHAFDVSGRTTRYVASGDVTGWLLGRWAMSEHDGRLRVATTRGERWAMSPGTAPRSDSAVSVLEEHENRLELIGSVAGLGKGEQVRAVRWFGDVATVVTFRQTDPLYTIDLSDPAHPAVLGELKVPGYSAYLHPIGDGLLLGVGQDATDEGRTLGTQVATFDLNDLAAPQRVDVLVEPGSGSNVEWDSRQFSYLPDARIALVPLWTQNGSQLWLVRVDDSGRLSVAARWSAGQQEYLARAMALPDGRLAVTTVGQGGHGRITMLTSPGTGGVDELGAVQLG